MSYFSKLLSVPSDVEEVLSQCWPMSDEPLASQFTPSYLAYQVLWSPTV